MTSANSPERRSVATSGPSVAPEGHSEQNSCKKHLSLELPTLVNQPAGQSSMRPANLPGRLDFAMREEPNKANAVISEDCQATAKAEEKIKKNKNLSQKKQDSAVKHQEEKKIILD
jgi:hypothetical protein